MSDYTHTPVTTRLSRWGRSPRYSDAHAAAARLQAQHPHLIVWFGESSGHYYVMDTEGLRAHPSIDAATVSVWWRTNRPQPRSGVAR